MSSIRMLAVPPGELKGKNHRFVAPRAAPYPIKWELALFPPAAGPVFDAPQAVELSD